LAELKHPPAAIEFKPDIEDAARRWEAYLDGEIIDRPLVSVTAHIEGRPTAPGSDYHGRVFGEMDRIIDNALTNYGSVYYGGEAMPSFGTSFGPDEIAVFCGAEFAWSDESGNTNWSVPSIDDWDDAPPIALDESHPLWLRIQEFYRRAAEKLAGKVLFTQIDLHTNMDLLAALRGPQRLCMDLLDRPETIDRAMAQARAVFPKIWRAIAEAGRMDEFGYCGGLYSMEGAAILQCDFICMISPAMFRRWVLPALEEEAQIVKHAFFHWDGPGAIKHMDDLTATKGLHTFGYVPNPGVDHIDRLDLYKAVQQRGKCVQVSGSFEQLKQMHRELRPEKTAYCTGAASPAEAEEILDWFVKNT